MANINLLPWREELREERKREFLVALAGVVVIAAGLLFLADRYVNGVIDNQNARNDYLRQQITTLDAQLAEIRELRRQKAELTERMSVIQDLQGTRPVIVRLFDELARTLPDGTFYSTMVRTGEVIRLEGVAESNGRVSALMRELENSDWFGEPELQQVRAADNTNIALPGGNIFILQVPITRPDQEE
ncbi:MAG: PilN domain-containing protein [Pseudohongiellaceae bacterium]